MTDVIKVGQADALERRTLLRLGRMLSSDERY